MTTAPTPAPSAQPLGERDTHNAQVLEICRLRADLSLAVEERASLANSLDGSEHCRKEAEAQLAIAVGGLQQAAGHGPSDVIARETLTKLKERGLANDT